ncbi:hypothetical protein ONZ51_g3951 [Trametes cubensis]|uniref:FAD-binding PCMH-type domain-containing protein n=1 Tax=Trametes cubensis TaxID=1111947 RepID=A0AAD7TXR5_9APHY|nr:hypothetical protein ONZ51_g3951 [Trametes cubensis]
MITENWDNGTFRSGHPGAMEAPNFETFVSSAGQLHACFLNTTLGAQRCEQGSVPVVGVEAHTANDIQVAVKFAAKHNLRLVIKNTGHDYLGRSSGRGSFMIWTHHMKNITVHDVFRPSGSLSSEIFEHAITVHAGVQWQEAYNAANASRRMIVGGVAAGGSVGAAGGWVLGGGQSLVSPVYGLGVDNVLEFTLVLANGSHITTNTYENPDLFWALRGGGGGTFGVITTVTYKTYPIVPTVSASLIASINSTQSTLSGSLAEAFTEFVRITPALTDVGWGGYVTYGPGAQGSLTYELVAIAPNVSWEEANATIVPYFDYMQALAKNSTGSGTAETQLTVSVAETTSYPSFLAWYTDNIPATGLVGSNLNLGSWLLPRYLVETDYKRVAETLSAVPGLSFEFVAGGAVSRPNASSTGLNPAWRKALVHTIFGVAWADGTSAAEIGEMQDTLKATSAKVRALAPDSGAYFNEASMFEPDPPKAFFGAHYEKLKAIKSLLADACALRLAIMLCLAAIVSLLLACSLAGATTTLVTATAAAAAAADPPDSVKKFRRLEDLTKQCKFGLGGLWFDLCPVFEGNDGGWTFALERKTPPTITKTSYNIRLRGPLEVDDNVPAHEQCPPGTWICSIVSNRRPLHSEEEPRVLQTIPIAGAMNLPNVPSYYPGVNITAQLAPPRQEPEARHDVLHIRLHGGFYVYGPQKADIQFVCDHDADEVPNITNIRLGLEWNVHIPMAPTSTEPVENDSPPSEVPEDLADDARGIAGRMSRSLLVLVLSSFTALLALVYVAWFPPARVRQYVTRFMKAHPRLARFRVGERVLMRWAYEDLELVDEFGYGEGEEDVMVNFAPDADPEGIPLKPSPRHGARAVYGAM